MRPVALGLLALTACSISDKNPTAGDGGVDGMLPVDDNAIPNTIITEAPKEFTNVGSSTFKFTADYANASFECSIDGESPLPCTSPYTRVLPDGAHAFSVRAINKLGKGDDSPAEHLWMIDTVAPNTMLTETPPPADNSVMVRFSFMSSEENVTFDCSLDGNSYVACDSGSDFGPITDGSHSFAVRAHDRAGNVDSSPAIHAWSVDTSTPDTQLLSGPEGAVASTSATFTFISPDAGGGATFQCAIDGGAMVACTSPFTIDNLAMGMHTFQVRVRDAVGNFDPTPSTRTWTVDLDAPETAIDSGPSGFVRVASANFTFSSNEVAVTYSCSLDGAPYAACTSPQNFANLAQGAHSFAVRATDAANHTDATPATRTWTVDTVAPEVTITGGPAESATVGPRAVFSFTASEGVVECGWDAGGFGPCNGSLGANLPDGAHTFRVRATDTAGNVTAATRNFIVACMPPPSAGAGGLLHLDDAGQTLANATGGASAVLGTTDQPEASDPALAAGRFGGGAELGAGDVVTWPAALGPMANVAVELWVRPDAAGNVFSAGGFTISTGARITATVGGGGAVQSAPIAAGAWHHVVASQGGGTLRLWVDGARTEVASAGSVDLDSITLGGVGGIDEVWVAQNAITDDESALERYCPL